jgi:UDP-N-acetylglucosamine:LPS N-acetylglucosamine transferase
MCRSTAGSGIDTRFYEAEFPVLVISSRAALGNYKVAKRITDAVASAGTAFHYTIEELIGERLVRNNFVRHRFICKRIPLLLRVSYGLPLGYYYKYYKERWFGNKYLGRLEKTITESGVKTVIATNHRAAFWVGALKHRNRISNRLWGVMTDYCMGMGWRHVFADQTDHLLGPVKKETIPMKFRIQYSEIKLPVDERYEKIGNIPGDKYQVLITGGGWGLGPISKTVTQLYETYDNLNLHIVCGENQELYCKLKCEFAGSTRVHVYGEVASLLPLMTSCGSVVTKPGGVTITEVYYAKRKLFLLRGLPVVEEANARFAKENFGGVLFSKTHFSEWIQQSTQ